MAQIGHQRHGKQSRITFEATNLRFTDWDTDYQAPEADTTNFESGGFEQGTVGIVVLAWNVSGPWDAQQNSYDDPPGFFPRDSAGALKFYENVSDNVFHSSTANRIMSAKNSASVKDLVKFSASGKSQGAVYTAPTGSV